MPHSSGGGSHGGGSHGGSHRSSSPRVSRRPYSGARRYIYYYPGTTRSEYLYCSGERTAPDNTQLRSAGFMSVALLLVALFMVKSAFTGPVKTDLNSYNASILIEDTAGLIDNTIPLMATLEDFQSLTGVTPSVEIVTHSDWQDNYASLEAFSYSEYLRQFDDEKHWLFVFSYPEDTSSGFVDWAWEGMIGDDVGGTISSAAEERMTGLMQSYLLRAEPDGVAEAISGAFREFSETVMDPPKGFGAYLPALIPVLFVAFLLLTVWTDYRRRKRLADAYPLGYDTPAERNCEYCGCMYVEGTVSVCPHCGVAIPAADPSEAL